jgi:hypothetical protein
MLQTVNTQGQVAWSNPIVNPIGSLPESWKGGIRNKREGDLLSSSASDVTLLYQEAVAVSSDAFAWQDIRVIQLRPSSNEIMVPPSENHCLM